MISHRVKAKNSNVGKQRLPKFMTSLVVTLDSLTRVTVHLILTEMKQFNQAETQLEKENNLFLVQSKKLADVGYRLEFRTLCPIGRFNNNIVTRVIYISNSHLSDIPFILFYVMLHSFFNLFSFCNACTLQQLWFSHPISQL